MVYSVNETELIEANLGLVHKIAKKIEREVHDAAIDYDDLFAEGCMGLLRAIRGFKPDKGFAFSTYAHVCISGEIRRYIDRNKPVHVPVNVVYLAIQINKYGLRKIEPEVIASTLNITVTRVNNALRYLKLSVQQFEKPLAVSSSDGSVLTLEDTIASPEEDMSFLYVNEFMKVLTPIERETLELLMYGYERKEIEKYHGYGRGTVYQRLEGIQRKYTKYIRERRVVVRT